MQMVLRIFEFHITKRKFRIMKYCIRRRGVISPPYIQNDFVIDR